MKKLMMAAAIVCAAVGVQASTVNWGGAFATVDNDYLQDGSYAMLVFSSTAFTGDPTTLNGTSLDNGGTVVATYNFNATDLSAASFATEYTGAYNEISGYYGVLIKDVNNDKLAWHSAGQATFADEQAAAVDLTYNLNWGNSETEWMGKNGYDVSVAGVPEPTSGLLLLLGMAGLALRRRRA